MGIGIVERRFRASSRVAKVHPQAQGTLRPNATTGANAGASWLSRAAETLASTPWQGYEGPHTFQQAIKVLF